MWGDNIDIHSNNISHGIKIIIIIISFLDLYYIENLVTQSYKMKLGVLHVAECGSEGLSYQIKRASSWMGVLLVTNAHSKTVDM